MCLWWIGSISLQTYKKDVFAIIAGEVARAFILRVRPREVSILAAIADLPMLHLRGGGFTEGRSEDGQNRAIRSPETGVPRTSLRYRFTNER
jgi:hypothetical protein